MFYFRISFSDQTLPSFVKPSKPPKVPTATSHAARLTFFMRRRARRGFAHSWRVGGLDIPGMANWKYCFPPISTEQGYLKLMWICLGYLKLFITEREQTQNLQSLSIFCNSSTFFHPKIIQKFQFLHLATSKTPPGTPSSPPPKWSPVSPSLPHPGLEQSALPTGSATSEGRTTSSIPQDVIF